MLFRWKWELWGKIPIKIFVNWNFWKIMKIFGISINKKIKNFTLLTIQKLKEAPKGMVEWVKYDFRTWKSHVWYLPILSRSSLSHIIFLIQFTSYMWSVNYYIKDVFNQFTSSSNNCVFLSSFKKIVTLMT